MMDERLLLDEIEHMSEDMDALATTVVTLINGLEAEGTDIQVIACLKCIENNLRYVSQRGMNTMRKQKRE